MLHSPPLQTLTHFEGNDISSVIQMRNKSKSREVCNLLPAPNCQVEKLFTEGA